MWPSKGSYDGWEQVAETSQVFEAELMALRLRESGIEAEVIDQSFKQEPLPNVRHHYYRGLEGLRKFLRAHQGSEDQFRKFNQGDNDVER